MIGFTIGVLIVSAIIVLVLQNLENRRRWEAFCRDNASEENSMANAGNNKLQGEKDNVGDSVPAPFQNEKFTNNS